MGELSKLPAEVLDGIDVQKLAERVAEMLLDEELLSRTTYSHAKLATIAHAIYRARRRRDKFFDHDLFADPMWDMLLDLFVNQVRGVRVSVTSLTLAARVPSTTGMRCIRILVERGLVIRTRVPDDARLVLLDLTSKGFQLMQQYLSDGITRHDLPTLA